MLSSPSLPLSLGQGSRENTRRVEPPKNGDKRTGDAAPKARDGRHMRFWKSQRVSRWQFNDRC